MRFYPTYCSFKSKQEKKKKRDYHLIFLILNMTTVTTSVCLGVGIKYIDPTSLLHHLYKANIKMHTTWHEKTKRSRKHSISENLAVFCSSERYMLRQGS